MPDLEVHAGQVYENEPIEITKERILKYADFSHDHNPIHVNEEFAAKTAFGEIIAHGMLSLNVIWSALTDLFGASGLPRMKLDIRFVKPVKKGTKIRARCEIVEGPEAAEGSPPDGAPIYRVRVACLNEAGEECITGEAEIVQEKEGEMS